MSSTTSACAPTPWPDRSAPTPPSPSSSSRMLSITRRESDVLLPRSLPRRPSPGARRPATRGQRCRPLQSPIPQASAPGSEINWQFAEAIRGISDPASPSHSESRERRVLQRTRGRAIHPPDRRNGWNDRVAAQALGFLYPAGDALSCSRTADESAARYAQAF